RSERGTSCITRTARLVPPTAPTSRGLLDHSPSSLHTCCTERESCAWGSRTRRSDTTDGVARFLLEIRSCSPYAPGRRLSGRISHLAEKPPASGERLVEGPKTLEISALLGCSNISEHPTVSSEPRGISASLLENPPLPVSARERPIGFVRFPA